MMNRVNSRSDFVMMTAPYTSSGYFIIILLLLLLLLFYYYYYYYYYTSSSFFDPSVFIHRLPMMGLHRRSSSTASCLWHSAACWISLPFCCRLNPLRCCQSTSCFVAPDFLYPISIFPVLLLVIFSYYYYTYDNIIIINDDSNKSNKDT